MAKITRTIPKYGTRCIPNNAKPYAWNNCPKKKSRTLIAVDNTVANIESKIIPTNETDIHSESNGTKAGASPDPTSPTDTPKTIGDIVGAYKSLVANECLKIFIQTKIDEGFAPDKIPKMGKIWQSNFYEHIIRDDLAYLRISEYIINNPKNWKGDKFYER